MTLVKRARNGVAVTLSAALILSGQMATMAQAEILSTDSVIAKYGQAAERDYLLGELQTAEIRNELIEMGVDPAEVETRLAALSDAEIRSMLVQFEAENAGGDILNTALTLFIILLVTDILCLTSIFRFTRCAR